MLQPSIFGSVLCVVLASAAWGQSAGPPSAARLVPEKVGFESASRPLGRLQERRAREQGEDPKPTPGDRIEAYIAKPEGNGPFPAVLVLPRCDGLTPYVREVLPQLLASWGYVALAVDSLTTRKVEQPCSSAAVDQFADAYGGLFYLARLPFVDRSRVAVLGIADGGRVALTLAEVEGSDMVVNPEKLTFKAGIAYYPECGHTGDKVTFPVLIMIGRDDRWARAKSCEDLMTCRAGDSAPTDLMVYPDTGFGFVERDYMYNEKPAEDSLRRAREFLARNLSSSR
jgi:dienelactone hydrolase